jgi:hypothetical protein
LKKRKTFFVLFLSIFLLSVIVVFILKDRQPLTPVGSFVQGEQLIKDVKKVNRIELSFDSTNFDRIDQFSKLNQAGVIKNVDSNSKILTLDVTNKGFEFIEGIEVRSGMRTWLYLSRRSYDPPIVGIYTWFRRSWMMDAFVDIYISKQEFEQLLSTIEHRDALTDEQLVDQLAKRWIEKHNYVPKKR